MRSIGSEHAQTRRWVTLGAEAVLIVFSVLLALALDEWRQDIAGPGDLALNSGALEQMDYETMVALSQTYTKQQEVEETEKILLDRLILLYQAYFQEGNVGGELRAFAATLTDFVLREREVLAEYDRALALTGR